MIVIHSQVMHLIITLVLLASTCHGLPTKQSGGKIVGGENADIKDYPHQLSLQSGGFHFCGASIISPDWALSAAHCVEGGDSTGLTLRGGTSQRGTGGSEYNVVQVIPHILYNRALSDYDFALLKVETPFVFGPGVAAIELPSQNENVATGTEAHVTGWGALKEAGLAPSQLQVVYVPIVCQGKCQARYLPRIITPRMICAGYDMGGKDSCQGDSGGPMVAGAKLIGVVSWGYGCASPNTPGVYARVASVRCWIHKHTGI